MSKLTGPNELPDRDSLFEPHELFRRYGDISPGEVPGFLSRIPQNASPMVSLPPAEERLANESGNRRNVRTLPAIEGGAVNDLPKK